jgi:hypothetical protein
LDATSVLRVGRGSAFIFFVTTAAEEPYPVLSLSSSDFKMSMLFPVMPKRTVNSDNGGAIHHVHFLHN